MFLGNLRYQQNLYLALQRLSVKPNSSAPSIGIAKSPSKPVSTRISNTSTFFDFETRSREFNFGVSRF